MQIKRVHKKRFKALTHSLCRQSVRIQNSFTTLQEVQASALYQYCSQSINTCRVTDYQQSNGKVLGARQFSSFFHFHYFFDRRSL